MELSLSKSGITSSIEDLPPHLKPGTLFILPIVLELDLPRLRLHPCSDCIFWLLTGPFLSNSSLPARALVEILCS